MSPIQSPSIRRRVALGATFMVLLRVSFRLIGLVNTLILVRLLLPGDFGLVGLATMAYSLLDTLSQLSFQLAIIRMADPQRMHYDTAWTLGIIRGALTALLAVATAEPLAAFVGDPRVVELSYVLAGLAFIQGFENIALVDFQRALQFDRIFRYQIIAKIVGVAVAIPAAFLLRNYWALICGIASTRLTSFVLGYIMKPYRPRYCLDGWRDLFHFSKWLMFTNVLSVIDQYSMTLVVGRIAGTVAIGFYQVANQIGSLPASEIAAPIRDPIYAGYSRVADNTEVLRHHFLSNLSLLIAVITPLSLGICLMAEPIVGLCLGKNWGAAVPLVQLAALYALFDAIGHSAISIYMALLRQRRFVVFYTIIVGVRLPAIVLGAILGGVTGAATALVITAIFDMILWNVGVPSELGVTAADLWGAAWRTICASSVMVLCVIAMLGLWSVPLEPVPAFARLLSISVAGAIVHVLVQYSVWALSGSPPSIEADVVAAIRLFARRALLLFVRDRPTSSAQRY